MAGIPYRHKTFNTGLCGKRLHEIQKSVCSRRFKNIFVTSENIITISVLKGAMSTENPPTYNIIYNRLMRYGEWLSILYDIIVHYCRPSVWDDDDGVQRNICTVAGLGSSLLWVRYPKVCWIAVTTIYNMNKLVGVQRRSSELKGSIIFSFHPHSVFTFSKFVYKTYL